MLNSAQDRNNDCPCYGCEERHRCCWDSCNRYKSWRRIRDEKWNEINLNKMKESLVNSYIFKEREKNKHPDCGIGKAARVAIYREKKELYKPKKARRTNAK